MTNQNSGEPSLCGKNCGFFGNPAINNLCSKCYKEFLMNHTMELANSITVTPMDDNEASALKEVGEIAQQVEKTSGESGNGVSENQSSNRCSFCRKRVGLTGFNCRCGQTFCSLRRYSDKHNCVFDYKTAGQDAITRANPVVKADKVGKI